MESNTKDLVMGLDIGTSSIKLVLLNLKNSLVELDLKKSTQSVKIKTDNELFNEQNVDMIVDLIIELFNEIPVNYFERIKAIQLCGQMHGLVMWNRETKKHTQLITWQDLRCDKEFLSNLPVKSISDLSIGFGGGTLFWLELNGILKQKPHSEMNSAGTIDDYVTFLLSNKNIMSIQNAMGWGFFDLKNANWQKELLEYSKFPSQLLPEVREPGYKVEDKCRLLNCGELIDAKIHTSLGDLQCSVYPCFEKDTDCVINMSTSGQVCFQIESSKFYEIKSKLPKSVAIFPFFGSKILLVSASLNGGNVLDKFIDMIFDWNRELAMIDANNNLPSRETIWNKLIELAQKNPATDLELSSATLFGERHDTKTFACLNNIRHSNLSVGQLFDAICAGLIKNLSAMINMEFLCCDLKCTRVIATGGAFVKNAVLRKHLERVFSNFEIVYKDSSDAALGAAYFLRDIYKN